MATSSDEYASGSNVRSFGSGRGGGRGHRGGRSNRRGRYRDVYPTHSVCASSLEDKNPIILAFRDHATALDDRHDRLERLVKMSRDVTIESKRIIFLLHRFHGSGNENEKDREWTREDEEVVKEAGNRLEALRNNALRRIALELQNQDHFLFHRSYTCGLQEYVEAATFHHHLKTGQLLGYEAVQRDLTYDAANNEEIQISVLLSDFILGVADFTGEVMRRAITAAGQGHVDDCFHLCSFLQGVHRGFLGAPKDGAHREVSRKVNVLEQSLKKVESVCYNVNVRGTEVPKHLLGTYLDVCSRGGGAEKNKRHDSALEGLDSLDDEQYDC